LVCNILAFSLFILGSRIVVVDVVVVVLEIVVAGRDVEEIKSPESSFSYLMRGLWEGVYIEKRI